MNIPNKDLAGEKAWEVLGVPVGASEEELRKAYLAKLRLHPPDRDPEAFERIRDAYEITRRPEMRMAKIMATEQICAPLASLVDGIPRERAFVGPKPWLAVIKEI